MYLITNREIIKRAKGLKRFGKKPNSEGPNELRLMRVERSSRSWKVTEVADRLSTAAVRKLKQQFDLDIDETQPWFGSLQVACDLFEQARDSGKSILFFVHGYNNDVEDVLTAAREIESLYDVIVVPFTWPANGGGKLSGAAAYLSDKADARASATALNRAVGKIARASCAGARTASSRTTVRPPMPGSRDCWKRNARSGSACCATAWATTCSSTR